MNREPIWKKVRDKVDDTGYKRDYVARQAGMKPAKLSLLLNGHRRMTAEDLQDICIAIGLNPNELFQTDQQTA